MPRKEINYDKTHFYKLVCRNLDIKDCYVGHTTDFIKRKSDHKARCNNTHNRGYNLPVYKFMRANGGWENFEMILINTLKCENAMEARKREREYKEELNATLNGNVPSRTFAEYIETNKDKRKEYAVEYRKNNKDKIKEYTEKNKEEKKKYNKNWRETNRENLLEKKKQYYYSRSEIIECECGVKHKLANKTTHCKSQKHQQYLQSLNQNNPQEPENDQT